MPNKTKPVYIERLKRTITAKPIGKKRILNVEVDSLLKRKIEEREKWLFFGGKSNYSNDGFDTLGNLPKKQLLNLKKKAPNILVVGAGFGDDIVKYNKDLNNNNIFPKIDSVSITNSLSENARTIITDYSLGIPLERLNPKIKKHKLLLDKFRGRFDQIISVYSSGVYTNHLIYSLGTLAIMLRPGGQAFIHIRNPIIYKKYGKYLVASYPNKTESGYDDYIKYLAKTKNQFTRQLKGALRTYLRDNSSFDVQFIDSESLYNNTDQIVVISRI